MKRPEGFDLEPPARSDRRPRASLLERPDGPPAPGTGGAAGRTRKKDVPAVRPRTVAVVVEPSSRRTRTSARSPQGARAADVTGELRSARRARLRAERAEIKRFTRAARRRRTAWLIGLGAVVALLLSVTAAVFSPALALRTIKVEGTDRLDPAAVTTALQGELGLPLALVDESRIADELSGFPLIRSFVVELEPPDSLRVVIDERQPIGVVVSGDIFQLVDPAGIVVETSQTRPDAVPLLELPLGDDGTVRRAVAGVLLALPDDVLAQVDRITATTRDDVTFTLRDSDQRVVWGSAENPERKALVLEALLAKWRSKGPGEYDVSGSGSATFRLF